jgi:hypothetical protein
MVRARFHTVSADSTYTWVYLYRCAIDACQSIWSDACVVALVRSFYDRRRKCLTNSTESRAAVLGTAAAITTTWQRRVIAHAQVRLSKCGRNLVQGSRCAVGVTYAPSFPWSAPIAVVDASGLWPGKVVTEVVPAREFSEAEPEHQDYP